MLQRLVFGLFTLCALTLTGCALSPQQLDPNPKLTGTINPVGQGQPVVVRVVDGRSSPALGTRGGLYPETSSIIVPADKLLPKLQAQTEAAVRLLGFTPSANAYNAPQLTLTLAELKYQSPKEGCTSPRPTSGRPCAWMCRTAAAVTTGAMGLRSTSASAWRPTSRPTPSWSATC